MAFFRKRPIVIEARQLGQDYDDDIEIARWSGAKILGEDDLQLEDPNTGALALIKLTTLEGVMFGMPGDWIVKGTQGEFYPVKSAIFNEIYEEADDAIS